MSDEPTGPTDDPLAGNGGPLGPAPAPSRLFLRRFAPAAGVGALAIVGAAVLLWWFYFRRPSGESTGAQGAGLGGSWKLAAQWADPASGASGRPSAQERLDALLKDIGRLTPELNSPALLNEIASDGRPWGDLRQPLAAAPSPRDRWEIRLLEGHTLDTYARQLDFFGIELGVLLPDGKILYVFNLSQAKPDTRVGDVGDEKRCYLTWQAGRLREADLELLARAGVDSTGRVVLKFVPPAVERKLAELEQAEAGSALDRVERTCFGIRAAESGYEFFIYEQIRRR